MKLVKVKPVFKEFFVVSLLLVASVLMHHFFIKNQISEELFMVGPNDQTNQMLIFKDFLYKEFTNGNFFYSFNYSGGSNFFSKLSYYYTTSIFYYLTVLGTWILNKLSIIGTPDIVYWGEVSIYVSILKSTIIAYLTAILISKYKVRKSVSLFASTFYAFSPIYFRHAVLWEFFTDAMLWVPIILLGSEKIFKGNKGWVFSIGVALTLFNNGYFAFANLLISGFYVLARLFVQLDTDEVTWVKKIQNIILYGAIGIGISLVGFLPFVKGFFDNSRSSIQVIAELWSNDLFSLENMLVLDTVQVIPFVYLFIIFCFKNYSSKVFRFFASITTILILMKYSPKVASLFNGLSFPQYRWHYITYIFIAITIGVGLEKVIREKSVKSTIFSSLIVLSIYYFTFEQLGADHEFNKKFFFIIILIGAVFLIFLSYAKYPKVQFLSLITLFILTVPFIKEFNNRLFDQYNLQKVTKSHLYDNFENPNTNFAQAIQYIENDADRFYRIEYIGVSNRGIAFDQSTFNNYSSFQNKYEREFIDYFAITNTKDNSVSIDGLGARQIINSLFQIDYVIASEEEQYIVPSGYERVKQFDNLSVFKNTYPLSFIHPVKNSYDIEAMTPEQFKDQQLIDGALVESGENSPMPLDNVITYNIEENEFYHDNYIENSENGVEIITNLESNKNFDEIVIDYTLKADTDSTNGNFNYRINDMEIGMSPPNGKYTLQQFHHQVSIPYDNQINFKFSGGSGYNFEINNIYGLTYDKLESRVQQDKALDYTLDFKQDEINIEFDNTENYTYMVLPLFYEDGWQLEINNENEEVENVNAGMIGFEIPNGKVHIQMKFVQPYLYISIFISVVSVIILILIDSNIMSAIKAKIIKQ